MPKENVNAATSAPAAQTENQPKKVTRRGIGSARGTSRLKFSHELARPNGLFIGHLESVVLSTITIGEDTTGMPSFNGMDIPRIVLTFASNEEDVNKRHYVNLSFNAVESNANTIPGGKDEWKVNAVFDWLKHLLNVYYLKGRELTEDEANALSLSFEDFDEDGNYVPIEPETVVAGWTSLFEAFENIMNRGGKEDACIYKDKNGKFIPVWIKLIRYIKNNKKGWQPVNNGELAFPTFVGEGCVERYVQNALPSIKLDAIKECIIPKNIEKAKAPNMPTAAGAGVGGPMAGGIPVDPMMAGSASGLGAGYEAIANEAGDDMPF